MTIDNGDIERAFSDDAEVKIGEGKHGGVSPDLDEAGDMSQADGLGGDPESGVLGSDYERPLAPEDADKVNNIAQQLELLPDMGQRGEVLHRDKVMEDVEWLRGLAKRITAVVGTGQG